jgi:hypothetical protein
MRPDELQRYCSPRVLVVRYPRSRKSNQPSRKCTEWMAVRADVPRALRKRSGPRRNPGPDFLRGCLPWFHGTRLRDTFHGTMGSIERVARPRGRPDAGDHVTRRTETTRDGARRARPQAARQRGRKLFPMQHLRRLSRRAGLRMGQDHEGPLPHPAQDRVQ